MEVKVNEKLHTVEGKRLEDGTYITPCPHGVGFEYINGWAYRMVGSVTCSVCSFNSNHIRNRVRAGDLKVICLHAPGSELNKDNLRILKTVKV